MCMRQKGGEKKHFQTSNKTKTKVTKTIKRWHFEGYYSALGLGKRNKKEKTRKADRTRRRILKMKATAVSQKRREKETNKELYGRQSGWGKLYTLVCTLYRMQPRSVFIWTWDGRTWYHPRYAHSITLSVHGVRLHALFKATARFKFLHWTDQKNGKSKPSNQGPVKQTGVANQSVVCLCLEVQGEGQKRKEEARRGEQSGTVSDGGWNPRLVSRLNKAFV